MGIKEQIKNASSLKKLEGLLRQASYYKEAAADTRRKWDREAEKQKKRLQSNFTVLV